MTEHLKDGGIERVLIVGGAGFIGSHFTDRLLGDESIERVTLYDNFTSGREWHYEHHVDDDRLVIVKGEVADLDRLTDAMTGHDTVIHLASNPDIAKAMTDPTVDFHEGTALTHNVTEAARVAEVGLVLYASGSGVYGDLGELPATEDHGPMIPVSTYGASKLAGEALLCSYAYMFGGRARAFRFANVVGPRQTHGVGFDFVRRLRDDPTRLTVLGDGTQSKSYIHVHDVVSAVLFAATHSGADPFAAFNVGTDDYVTVREIVALAIDVLDLDPAVVEVVYGTENRGWKGDVPIVRIATDRIRALGWTCQRNTEAALRASIEAMLSDVDAGRLT
jgi:UDP-glucose 4-epimerase